MGKNSVLLIRASYESETTRNFRRVTPCDLDTVIPMLEDRPNLSDIDAGYYDGYIITGSSSSVLDDKNWIDSVQEFIYSRISEDDPVLGICWGHQAIADTIGGTVERGDKRELGYRNISITTDMTNKYGEVCVDRQGIFTGFPDNFIAFETHEDYVVDLPKESKILAQNESGIQSYKYRNAYGVQFHPEYDFETALNIYKKYKSEETIPEVPRVSVDDWARSEISKDVIRNFVDFVVD